VRRRRLANGLIVAQFVLAGVLVTGAGLLVRSTLALYARGPGFASDDRVVFELRAQDGHLHGMLRSKGLSEEDAQKALTNGTEPYWSPKSVFREAAVHRIARLPGVLGVTTTSATPMGGGYWLTPVARDGNDRGRSATTETLLTLVEPNYLHEMRIPIFQGRSFNQDDRAHSEAVVVVSALIARRLWPRQNPIGKRLQSKMLKGEPWFTVVGVAGDTRDDGMDKPTVPHVYQPARQNQWWHGGDCVIVRTGLEPQALVALVRRAVGHDPAITIARIYRLDRVVHDSAWRLNAATLLAAGLAALSLLLAVGGVYGVLSHAVRERTREFGLRIALGAGRRQVMWLAASHALAIVALGLGIGLTCAAGLTQYLRSLLFGIEPLDPVTFAGATLALLTAAALASYLPARRAATVDASL
jgi:putative ABC transport system permease protein